MKTELMTHDPKDGKRIMLPIPIHTAAVVVTLDDDTELHMMLDKASGTLSVRSGGLKTGRLVIYPIVTNEVHIDIEAHHA